MDGDKMETPVMERAPQARLERRRNQVLRERFDAAETLLKPLLGSPESHNGAAFFRAMNRLHAVYPDLSPSEIEALVAAVVRSFQSRAAAG
jgi:hypothetical protein